MYETVKEFIDAHFKHFNAATVVDASKAYAEHIDKGGKMFVTLAGAMSTAELGTILAEMIRQDKVHAICCTGANLEEDVFNLVAHNHYERIPDWRALSAQDEERLLEKGMNRVTDTCIPEEAAMLRIDAHMEKVWGKGVRKFPYEFFYELFEENVLEWQIPREHSWLYAAYQKNIPVFVPGWEDSTMGNKFVGHAMKGDFPIDTVKSGLETMEFLVKWYREQKTSVGFFQIGGGIAGDFPICVVPMIRQDLQENCPLWGYFCQISDSTTSYGSYSGATPNEKITWEKLSPTTPRFMIESDATIVVPLVFAYVLGSKR